MNILLLCSAFNGLSQRAWIELRAQGHEVSVRLAIDSPSICNEVEAIDPDLIICPFLRDRVPAVVWQRYRTIIIHPGPKGDRGPSSLDWAISDGESSWGVTALEAVEEMDAGAIWATRTFVMPDEPPRKSDLYNGPVVDAAMELIGEVVDKAADRTFLPEPLDIRRPDVTGRLRSLMRQADRTFSWWNSTERIVRRIRAADGSPGVRAELCGVDVSVFGASPGPDVPGEAGTIVRRRRGAILVRTGDGSVWISHVRRHREDRPSVKLPAASALAEHVDDVPEMIEPLAADVSPHREISYHREGDVGVLHFDFPNGAMSSEQCRKLLAALQRAADQDTRVLVIGGGASFSNGIHLNVIEAATNPAAEAWRNINAIDDVCREIITCTDQLVVAAVNGNAGAGGVMMALGADRVVLRDGVVLNPHYRTMGLYGSEYWTYTLPRRVGHDRAQLLTEECLPIGCAEAVTIGLADDVLTCGFDEFGDAIAEYAGGLATGDMFERLLASKRARRRSDEAHRPLDSYRVRELAEMSRDIFDDQHGFSRARKAFVSKSRPASTPAHLINPRPQPFTDALGATVNSESFVNAPLVG